MKKLVALILALSMMFALCGCGGTSESTEEKKEETKEIELTTENIFDYLHVDLKWDGNDVTISTYPTAGGSFQNVQLVIRVWLSSSRSSSSAREFNADVYLVKSDASYKYAQSLAKEGEYKEDYFKGYLITIIKLPADGKYSETHSTMKATFMAENCGDIEMTSDYYRYDERENGHISPVFVCGLLPESTQIVSGTFIPLS